MKIPSSIILDEELLARFILQKSWIREDKTVRQEVFIPPANLELSVTCHANLKENEIWNIGQRVADVSTRILYGRADIQMVSVRQRNLVAEKDPTDENPNHTIIINWPNDKPSQKMIAIELAASSQFISTPTS